MAKRFTDLNELTTPATDDQLAIVDTSANETKRIKLTNLLTNFIDALHLKSNSVITDKILDGAVTNPKAGFTVTSAGDKTGRIQLGNLLIQWGVASVAQGGGSTVTLPVAYTQVPGVQLTLIDPSAWTVWVSTISTTQLAIKHSYGSGPLNIMWLTIGTKV